MRRSESKGGEKPCEAASVICFVKNFLTGQSEN
jgi:hypothetical protein